MEKTFCYILEFAEKHDVWISFTIGSSGCDVHMAKNRFLETITVPKEKLENMDRDYISEVLNCLLIRLVSKGEIDEWLRDNIVERIGKWAIKEVDINEL